MTTAPSVADAIRLQGRALYYWRVFQQHGYYDAAALRTYGHLVYKSEGAFEQAFGTHEPVEMLRRAEAAARRQEVGERLYRDLVTFRRQPRGDSSDSVGTGVLINAPV